MKTIVNGNKKIATKIIDYVEDYFDEKGGVVQKSRKASYVRCKQLARYLMRKHTDLTLTSIAQMTGNADHSTVIYSVSVWEDYLDYDKQVRYDTNYVEMKMKLNNLIDWSDVTIDIDKEITRVNQLKSCIIAYKQRKDELKTFNAIMDKKIRNSEEDIDYEKGKIKCLSRLVTYLEKKYITNLIVQV